LNDRGRSYAYEVPKKINPIRAFYFLLHNN